MNTYSSSRFLASCILAAGFLLLLPLILMGWPLDGLVIRHSEAGSQTETAPLFHSPVLLGCSVTNAIVHSVQLTPVIDEYRIQEGRIWAWREKVQSHNAGLPSLKPDQGRFVFDPPWMIVEGTRESWDRIAYRVGTETLGKNVLCVFPHPCRNLWEELPGKRLLLQATRATLFAGVGFTPQ